MNSEFKRFIVWLKERTPCKDCKQFYHPNCMEFDHVPERGQKIATIGVIAQKADEKTLCEEIDKCDIICANCHRLRTAKRGVSEETRQKMSKSQKGKKLPASTRKKIKAAQAKMREKRLGPFKHLPLP